MSSITEMASLYDLVRI